MRHISLWALLLLLPACAKLGDDLAALRAAKPGVNTFPQALASEYLAYSESLAEEGHPIRADRFAQKGLAALSGKEVQPEEKASLAETRAALMSVLTPDLKEIAPVKAARAQLMFDCWVDKESVCKESFKQAFADLQPLADALVHGENNRFTARFDAKSAEANAHVNGVLDVIGKRVSGLGHYEVNIVPPFKKTNLASRRVLALEKGLIARGVDAGRITVGHKTSSKEVTLSSDQQSRSPDAVELSIQTVTQPTDAGKP